MATKKKLSAWKERIARGAKLPAGFTATGWSLPGEGLPQIGGSLFGCPVMATVNGEEVPVHCPKCAAPVVLDLQTLLTFVAAAVDPRDREALEASLARAEMLCAACWVLELAASHHVVMRDKKGRTVDLEGLEIWTLDKDERVVEKTFYAGPIGELLPTLEDLRTSALTVIRARGLARVFAMPAGSKSWEDHYDI